MASFLDRIMRPVGVTERVAAALPMISPLSASTAQQIVYSEYFAGEIGEVTRLGAMQIPALKRARDLLCSTVAGTQLKELRGEEDVTPAWLRNSKTGVSPYHRMLYTADDILFFDWSLWGVNRSESSGAILDAWRVPFERWAADSSGRITIDGKPVTSEQVILIPGNGSGGILAAGAQTIKGYRAMERAWVGRVQNPIPLVELHQTSDDALVPDGTEEDESDEIQRLIDEWASARTSPTGAVGYTPQQIELRVHGDVKHELFVEGRNAGVLDVARLVGIPGSLLDGSMATATLTYSTTEGKRSEFDLYTTPLYLDPIEARLSLDDVAPQGHVIRFDRSARAASVAPALTEPLED